MQGLMELMTNKEWMISPDYVKGILPVLKNNLNNHIALGKFEKKQPYAMVAGEGGLKPVEYQVTEGGLTFSRWDLANMTKPFVSIMPVDGPITRSGDACTYGSIDLRDWIMTAADNENCKGHIFYINTPGGSAWAKNDFQQGIDYAHAKGQKVIAYIDGDCFSAGMYLAALCDEVFVMNPNDELGCIGVLASFFTLANGAKNQFTDETYHEIYDPQSFDKNKWYRDIAENGDESEIVAELAELGQEFRNTIHESFPNATEEHVHGKTFRASKVMGVFVDGVMTLGECIQHVFDIANGNAKAVNRAAGETINNQTKNTGMNIFEKIRNSITQVEAEAQAEAGNQQGQNDEIATLNERIAQLEQERNDAQAQVETLTAERDTLNEQVTNLTAERDAKADEVTNLTAERDNLQNSLDEANNTIAARDEEIKNLKSQLGSDYQPGNRMNGQPAGDGKQDENKQSSEERKNAVREALNKQKKNEKK